MTTTPRSLDPIDGAALDATPMSAVHVPPVSGRWTDRRLFPLLILGLLVFYGLLQNPYWVPAGDSEVYISIARDLARGMGYEFNGQPVAMVPPGWPWVMALVMSVAPYFLVLKLLAMSFTIGWLAIFYWIARRFVAPGPAALVIVLAAVLSHVYQSTFWLISESLFCLVSAGSLLLAFQVREGRQQIWRIGLLVLLCGAAVTVRWAGVLGGMLVVAVLVDGQLWPRLADRRSLVRWWIFVCVVAVALRYVPWLSVLLSCGLVAAVVLRKHRHSKADYVSLLRWSLALFCAVVTIWTFLTLRSALDVSPEQAAAAAAFGGTGEVPTETPETEPDTADAGTNQVAQTYSIITGTSHTTEYLTRFVGWGRWLSWLYWQPFRAAAGSNLIEWVAIGAGWILIALLLTLAVRDALRCRWFWLAIVLYCGVLALNWPLPNARYLVPLAVPLTLGILLASRQVQAWLTHRLGKWLIQTGLVLFIGGVLLCNLALWCIDVSVARSSDFYATYEAGLNQQIIAAARIINDSDAGEGGISVTPRYRNLNRTRRSPFGLRSTVMLTGREVMMLPAKWQGTDPGPRLANHLYEHGIRYYIHQTEISPWRVWHFRAGWWQRRITGEAPDNPDSGWQLYRVDGPEEMTRIRLTPSEGWPTRVPGL